MEFDPTQTFLIAAHGKLTELTNARADLDKEYTKKRADIDAHILKWKRAVDGVMAVTETEQIDPADVEVSAFIDGKAGRQTIKFTDGVRLCLRQRGDKPASAPDIRDGLINLGFNFGKYAQPLVPIHNCLKRLVEQKEAEAVKNDEGQIVGYKWISPIEQALAEEYPRFDYTVQLDIEVQRAMEETMRNVEANQRAAEKAAMAEIERIQQMHKHFVKTTKKG
jgi:hypothetical protein